MNWQSVARLGSVYGHCHLHFGLAYGQKQRIGECCHKQQKSSVRWSVLCCIMREQRNRALDCVFQRCWIIPISASSVFLSLAIFHVCLSLWLPPPSCFSQYREDIVKALCQPISVEQLKGLAPKGTYVSQSLSNAGHMEYLTVHWVSGALSTPCLWFPLSQSLNIVDPCSSKTMKTLTVTFFLCCLFVFSW